MQLKEFSREIISYVPREGDIGMANRMINDAIQTPRNRDLMVSFLREFLPWSFSTKGEGQNIQFVEFTTKTKSPKRIAECQDAVDTFLADEKNNIWNWAKAAAPAKPKDSLKMLAKAVKLAVEGDDKATQPQQPGAIVATLFESGITLDMLVNNSEALQFVVEEEQAKKAA